MFLVWDFYGLLMAFLPGFLLGQREQMDVVLTEIPLVQFRRPEVECRGTRGASPPRVGRIVRQEPLADWVALNCEDWRVVSAAQLSGISHLKLTA